MRRTARRVDPAYLRRLALWYLERWEGSRDTVRRTLVKRVDRAVAAHAQDRAELLRQVEGVLDALEAEGLVDDARFAQALVARLRARGGSTRRIRAALALKGIAPDVAAAALDEGDTPGPSDERLAAIRYARRRRFGPWRRVDADADKLRKELASMARAGFGYPVARAILDAEDAHALEDELPIGW
ncbi:MAG: RecX family transcriptional regulator [Alphaproteobacteria bacterium]|nr:RecX family transcriptional regulator [Alphaproteobacteria bacterium]